MTIISIFETSGDGWYVKFKTDEDYDFEMILGALKSYVPLHYRYFDQNLKRWHITQSSHDSFRRWLKYVRRSHQAQIEWQEEGSGSQAGNFEASQRTITDDAYAALHLRPGAPPELVKAAYRVLAQLNHPDHGGDTHTMQKINAAYELLVGERKAA